MKRQETRVVKRSGAPQGMAVLRAWLCLLRICRAGGSASRFGAMAIAWLLVFAWTTTAAPISHSSIKTASEAAGADQSLVLVVFSAEWCGPCKRLKAETLKSPEFNEQAGALHLVEIDIDAQPGLARDYAVSAVPTLVLLTPDGKVAARGAGFMHTAELLLWLREARDRVKEGKWEGTAPSSKLAAFITRAEADALTTNDLVRLVAFLGEPDPADREAAAKLLAAERGRAIPPLIEGVTNSYLGVRIGSMELLQRLAPESPSADPWLAPAELVETAAALRHWWAQTGKLSSTNTTPTSDPSRVGSIAAAVEALRGSDPARSTDAMSTLVGCGAAALPAVRAAIKACEKAGDQRGLWRLEDVRWAILIPDEIDQRAQGVRGVLARGAGPERQSAAGRLGGAGRGALPALAELAGDADPLVVECALRGLAGLGDKDAIAPMAALLKSEDSNLRMTTAQALGHTRNTAALPALLAVLDDTDEVVACAALSAIEEIHGERQYSSSKVPQSVEVIQGLGKCLADPRWRVKATAAEIVGKLETQALIENLKPLLDDPDGFVVKNSLEALRQLKASPEPEKLMGVARRQPALRAEVMSLLINWATPDAIKAVTAAYRSGSIEDRLAILRGLCAGAEDVSDTSTWRDLLAQAAQEPDARLRRAAAQALGAQPSRIAAAAIGPLLSDEDAETRSAAAGVVLSVLAGQRMVSRSDSHTHGSSVETWLDEADSSSSNHSSSKTNRPAATPEQLANWNAALRQKAGSTPEPLVAAALYATGQSNTELPRLQRALETADAAALARLGRSAAMKVILPRLTWPEGQAVVERLCGSPALFLRLVTCPGKTAPGLKAFLFEPARFRAAVESASSEDLEQFLPGVLGSGKAEWSLLSAKPEVAAVVGALLESTNAAWRAAAIYSLGKQREEKNLPVFERATQDSNSWVRVAALNALARTAKDHAVLERCLGPMLGDPDKSVARQAALGLLEPETRAAAGLDYGSSYFQFEKIEVWSGDFGQSSDQRPLEALPGKPAFLEQARRGVSEKSGEEAGLMALLLAQYGDFSGLDRLLPGLKLADQRQDEMLGLVLAEVALSHDVKYLPTLKQAAQAAKDDSQFRRLLQALKGMSGPEARELRLQINKRMRQGTP